MLRETTREYARPMSHRNPPAIPADTSDEVWQLQMAAIARRPVADRLAEWAALNRAISQMEADGIRRRHPNYSDQQVVLAAARIRYGDELVRAAWPNERLLDP